MHYKLTNYRQKEIIRRFSQSPQCAALCPATYQAHSIECDISSGASFDNDSNGIPDECESVGVAYCFGDGSGTACPCANFGAAGEGCANGNGSGAILSASGSTSVVADDLLLHGSQLVPGTAALLFSGTTRINGGMGNQFGDGLRCVGGPVKRLGVRISSPTGEATWGPGYAAAQGWVPGEVRTMQIWYRDTPAGTPCGNPFNLGNGLEVTYDI